MLIYFFGGEILIFLMNHYFMCIQALCHIMCVLESGGDESL